LWVCKSAATAAPHGVAAISNAATAPRFNIRGLVPRIEHRQAVAPHNLKIWQKMY
jgi:hypothetical protein